MRGHGDSSMGWASISRTDVAGDLVALIRHLGGPRDHRRALPVGRSGHHRRRHGTRPGSAIVEVGPFTKKVEVSLGGLFRVHRCPPRFVPAGPGAVPAQPERLDGLPGPRLPGKAGRLRRLHDGPAAELDRPVGRVPQDREDHPGRRRRPAAARLLPGSHHHGRRGPRLRRSSGRGRGDRRGDIQRGRHGRDDQGRGPLYPHAQRPDEVAGLITGFVRDHNLS